MSCRKKLKNQETFHFEESDVLPAPSVSALHKKRSVQERLTPKAGNLSHYLGGPGGLLPRTPSGSPGSVASLRSVTAQPTINNNNRYQPKSQSQSQVPAKPRTAPVTPRAKPDPVLDRIVARLKAGMSLSEPGSSLGEVGGPGLPGVCLCERSTKLVLCQLCGATFPGRTALRCPSHPRRIFLQDLQRCKVCQAGNLDNLKEFDLPLGMKETLGNVREI